MMLDGPTRSAAPARRTLAAAIATAAIFAGPAAAQDILVAQNFPITPGQKATASQVAQAGVPLSELAPNAPDEYTVKRGDTLWAISRLFLRSPWRWPELWGMNITEIRNPHLIYPGQQLYLDKSGGRARLLTRRTDGQIPTDTVRVSPRVRIEGLSDLPLPTLQPQLIEPFLNEALIVEEGVLARAPRIVSAPDSRVLITKGDRAYARGPGGTPFLQQRPGYPERFRIFRDAKALKDPVTQQVLGYEAAYLGQAQLVRGEAMQPVKVSTGAEKETPIPATIDITAAREEMRVGDRLLPEPERPFVSYVPRAPGQPVDGSIVSVYGDAVAFAGQNQVVVINKGIADGLESGHVLAILKDGARFTDRSEFKTGTGEAVKLPDERNGLMMVFRTFERLSYALILEITDGVKIGDRVINPR